MEGNFFYATASFLFHFDNVNPSIGGILFPTLKKSTNTHTFPTICTSLPKGAHFRLPIFTYLIRCRKILNSADEAFHAPSISKWNNPLSHHRHRCTLRRPFNFIPTNAASTETHRINIWFHIFFFCLTGIFFGFLIPEANFPRFAEPIPNITVTIGRDALLACVVENLKGYRVSTDWIVGEEFSRPGLIIVMGRIYQWQKSMA